MHLLYKSISRQCCSWWLHPTRKTSRFLCRRGVMQALPPGRMNTNKMLCTSLGGQFTHARPRSQTPARPGRTPAAVGRPSDKPRRRHHLRRPLPTRRYSIRVADTATVPVPRARPLAHPPP